MIVGGGGLPPIVSQGMEKQMRENTAQPVPAVPGQVVPGDPQPVQAVAGFSQPGELFNYHYRLKMNKTLKRPVVQVIDRKNGTVLFEIPPRQVIRMLSDLEKAPGESSVDQKA